MILVLCPTRSRLWAAREAYQSFLDTRERSETEILFVVDDDDPELKHYVESGLSLLVQTRPGSMNAALNRAASWVLMKSPTWSILGFIGDDHRFRTQGWDRAIGDHLAKVGGGVAYADDLLQRMNLPTMWFVSRRIVETFGMGLPELHHLWIDNYWKELAEAAHCLYYFPDIVIEHMHPAAGKAGWDANYERVNSGAMIDHDRAAFLRWQATRLVVDAEKLRQILE